MPTYYAGAGNYRITCRDCDRQIETVGRPTRDGYGRLITLTEDRTVRIEDVFGYDANAVSGRWPEGRFYSICRACTANRRARRGRRPATPRVPGTTAETLAAAANLTRRFGVEIECYTAPGIGYQQVADALAAAGLTVGRGRTAWSVVGDGSLSQRGVEVVSPALSGDDGREQIKTACRVLRSLGCTVNRTCGLHVHHEVNDLTVAGFQRLARLWNDNRHLIDGLVAPSRREAANPYYCRPLDSRTLSRIASATTLQDIQRLYTSHYQPERYRTLNFCTYGRLGTVEVRQHQGTLDAEKIITWVEFAQAIIDQARTSAETPTYTRMRDFIAGLTHLGETAGTFLLGRAVRFGATEI